MGFGRWLRAVGLIGSVAFLLGMGLTRPEPAPVACLTEPGLVWPIAGKRRVTSQYGWRLHPTLRARRFHNGVDLRARSGTPIRAAGDGVVRVGEDGISGRYVVLDVGHATTISYSHLSEVRVKRGQRVVAGEVVGLSGTTGRSTGPHLHLTTRVRGRSVDPLRVRCWR